MSLISGRDSVVPYDCSVKAFNCKDECSPSTSEGQYADETGLSTYMTKPDGQSQTMNDWVSSSAPLERTTYVNLAIIRLERKVRKGGCMRIA